MVREEDDRRSGLASQASERGIALVAVLWIQAAIVLFILPPNQMAGYSLAATTALLALYWFGWLRTRFAGPPVVTLR